jgi:F-type H+-transporting ATPase subunit delta
MSNNGKPDLFTTEQQQLGSVYAKALLGVGEKSGDTTKLLEELSAVAEAVSNQPSLSNTLQSPQVGAEEKLKLVGKIFEKKVSVPMMNFLKVLVGKDRFDCVAAISAAAKQLNDEKSGEIQATVTTAEEIDAKSRDEIAKQLSTKLGKKVKLDSVVDASVVGGVVVRVGDTVYDNSVVGQLQQVRQRAMEKATEAIREKLDRFATGT